MNDTLNTLLGTAGGIVGAIGGLGGGIFLAIMVIFTLVCVCPFFCLLALMLGTPIDSSSMLLLSMV
jgi:nitrate/nitrite transporter NarK